MYMIREQNRTEAHCDYATDQAVPSNISRLKSCSTHTGKELMCSSSATKTCPTMAAMQGAHFRTADPSGNAFSLHFSLVLPVDIYVICTCNVIYASYSSSSSL